jgi:hypothetical protein
VRVDPLEHVDEHRHQLVVTQPRLLRLELLDLDRVDESVSAGIYIRTSI